MGVAVGRAEDPALHRQEQDDGVSGRGRQARSHAGHRHGRDQVPSLGGQEPQVARERPPNRAPAPGDRAGQAEPHERGRLQVGQSPAELPAHIISERTWHWPTSANKPEPRPDERRQVTSRQGEHAARQSRPGHESDRLPRVEPVFARVVKPGIAQLGQEPCQQKAVGDHHQERDEHGLRDQAVPQRQIGAAGKPGHDPVKRVERRTAPDERRPASCAPEPAHEEPTP